MRLIIAVTFLLSLAECRRHLCDDGTRPICPDGRRAVYNRPTGKNSKKSKYFPPPVCSGEGPPFCPDGSTPKFRFNTCSNEEKKCPKGQGQGPHDKPFRHCADGSQCRCPGGGEGCKFRYKRCKNGQKCHKRCKSGVPHCPWFTKNRNPHNGTRIHNTGPNRPGNKEGGHNWGREFHGHLPLPLLGNPLQHCRNMFSYYGDCLWLWEVNPYDPKVGATFADGCCPTDFRNEHCKCDCCWPKVAGVDESCFGIAPACDSPGTGYNCSNPGPSRWHPPAPICPWQDPQEPP